MKYKEKHEFIRLMNEKLLEAIESKKTAVEWLSDEIGLEYLENKFFIAKQLERKQLIDVAMYHKDSSVEINCITSYIDSHYNNTKK